MPSHKKVRRTTGNAELRIRHVTQRGYLHLDKMTIVFTARIERQLTMPIVQIIILELDSALLGKRKSGHFVPNLGNPQTVRKRASPILTRAISNLETGDDLMQQRSESWRCLAMRRIFALACFALTLTLFFPSNLPVF